MWDGVKMVKVLVPGTAGFTGNVCGLCGNFDGDKTNDRALGDHVFARRRSFGLCPGQAATGTQGHQVYMGSVYKQCRGIELHVIMHVAVVTEMMMTMMIIMMREEE